MEKNNILLLDIDESSREVRENTLQEIVDFCRKHDLILDLATSDVVMFIRDKFGGEITIV